MQVHLLNLQIRFIYQGHWVKIKVKMRLRVACLRLKSNLVTDESDFLCAVDIFVYTCRS